MDLSFPIIEYNPDLSASEHGARHGERFRDGIRELVQIRRELIAERKPNVEQAALDLFAAETWEATGIYAPNIWQELEGIREAAGVSVTDMVVLNNYTDFRDISFPEEGCSTAAIRREGKVYCAYTWDMHGSAADYIALLKLPATDLRPAAVLLTHVGCSGMSGFTAAGTAVAINNLNATQAVPAPMWPVVVRKLLEQPAVLVMESLLKNTPVGGGRNYLLVDEGSASMHEVEPGGQKPYASLEDCSEIYHSNHFLSEEMRGIENQESLSSTTHSRLELLREKVPAANSLEDLEQILLSHDGQPKSICSHFQSGSQDPSMTCAAAVVDLSASKAVFWRGCSKSKAKKIRHEIFLEEN